MIMNDQLRDMINAAAPRPSELRDAALQTRHGRAARRRAWRRSIDGITTIEEVIRETVHEA